MSNIDKIKEVLNKAKNNECWLQGTTLYWELDKDKKETDLEGSLPQIVEEIDKDKNLEIDSVEMSFVIRFRK